MQTQISTRAAHAWRQATKAALSALEVTIVLGVIAVGSSLGITYFTNYINHQVTQSAADQLKVLTDAVSAYTVDHRAALATAAATSPNFITTISEADLKDGTVKYLKADESLVNPFGQTYEVLVKGSATSATDQKIMPFIVSDGDDSMIERGDARKVAMSLGGTAGYTTTDEPETIVGTNDLWRFDVAEWGLAPKPERIAAAVFYEDGIDMVDLSGLLHRAYDPANPQYNRMETSIDMNAHDLNNAGNVATNSATVGDGGLKSKGDIATDANVIAAGQLSSNSVVTNSVQSGGPVTASGNVTGNRLTSNEYVQINGQAVENTACSPNGLVGRTAAGLLLSCQSGVWKKPESTWSRAAATCPNGTVYTGGACKAISSFAPASGGDPRAYWASCTITDGYYFPPGYRCYRTDSGGWAYLCCPA